MAQAQVVLPLRHQRGGIGDMIPNTVADVLEWSVDGAAYVPGRAQE